MSKGELTYIYHLSKFRNLFSKLKDYFVKMILNLFNEFEEAVNLWYYIDITLRTMVGKKRYTLKVPIFACCRDKNYCENIVNQLYAELRESFRFESEFHQISKSDINTKVEQLKYTYRDCKVLSLPYSVIRARSQRFNPNLPFLDIGSNRDPLIDYDTINKEPFVTFIRPRDFIYEHLDDFKCYINQDIL